MAIIVYFQIDLLSHHLYHYLMNKMFIELSEFSPSKFLGDNPDPWVFSLRINAAYYYELWMISVNDNPSPMMNFLFYLFHPMQLEIFGVECSGYMKI